jgi:hypothetical protein
MTMLNNTSPYAVTAPGVRRGAPIGQCLDACIADATFTASSTAGAST